MSKKQKFFSLFIEFPVAENRPSQKNIEGRNKTAKNHCDISIKIKRYCRWENLSRKKNRKSAIVAINNSKMSSATPYSCVNWNPAINEASNGSKENLLSIQAWMKEQYFLSNTDDSCISLKMKQTYLMQREIINEKGQPILAVSKTGTVIS